MKLIRLGHDVKRPIINEGYNFEIIKANLVPELNKLQVLYSMTEIDSEKMIPYTDSILYVQDYEIDTNPNSKFMELLEWACFNEIYCAYYLDTDIVEGCAGMCKIVQEDDGTLNLKVTGSYATNLSYVEEMEYDEEKINGVGNSWNDLREGCREILSRYNLIDLQSSLCTHQSLSTVNGANIVKEHYTKEDAELADRFRIDMTEHIRKEFGINLTLSDISELDSFLFQLLPEGIELYEEHNHEVRG